MTTERHVAASVAVADCAAAVAAQLARDSAPERARQQTAEDAALTLAVLSQSLALDRPELLLDHAGWSHSVAVHRGAPADHVPGLLLRQRELLAQCLAPDAASLCAQLLQAAADALPRSAMNPACLIGQADPLAAAYLQALLGADRHSAQQLVAAAVQAGMPVERLHLRVLQPAMHEVGRLWQTGAISVAEEHFCAASTAIVIARLPPPSVAAGSARTAVVTCVAGEMHEIGPRMLSDLLERQGWRSYCVGANTPSQDVIKTVIDQRADLLALSATMAPHLREVQALIAAVRALPECASLRIVVGGRPFGLCPDLWRQVGADGWGADAAQGCAACERLVPASN